MGTTPDVIIGKEDGLVEIYSIDSFDVATLKKFYVRLIFSWFFTIFNAWTRIAAWNRCVSSNTFIF